MSRIPKNRDTIKTTIYVLKDPETEEVRYVGKTVKLLKYRLQDHLYRKRKTKTGETNHRINWIQSLINKDLIPIIQEIDNCLWNESQELEKFWIKKYRDLGYKLVNSTDGGEGNLGNKWTSKRREIQKRSSKTVKVFQYSLKGDLIKEWSCINDAAKFTNSNSSKIVRCCRHPNKFSKHNNFRWSYNKLDIDQINSLFKLYEIHQFNEFNELIASYKSVSEASKLSGYSDDCIYNSIKNVSGNNNVGPKIKFRWKRIYL